MKISIVTPSFNQGNFIGQTILSVINQGSFDIEYFIYDNKSSDNTIEILEKYSDRINWISEKDNGQSEAINKGLKKATGDIVCYINSDDYFLEGCFDKVIQIFQKNPDIMWLSGDCDIVDEKGNKIQSLVSIYKRILKKFPQKMTLKMANYIIQPATFWRRELLDEIGYFDESLRYTMDYDFWLRIIDKYPLKVINQKFCGFRIHGSSKGGSLYKKQFDEELNVLKRYSKNPLVNFIHLLHNKLIVSVYKFIK